MWANKMKAIIKDGRVVATALDDYPVQGWEQDVLDAPDGLTVENMHEYVYQDGALERPVAKLERDKRNQLLAETDWVVVMHSEKGTAVPSDWAAYRQALRDITSQQGFPDTINWPTKP